MYFRVFSHDSFWNLDISTVNFTIVSVTIQFISNIDLDIPYIGNNDESIFALTIKLSNYSCVRSEKRFPFQSMDVLFQSINCHYTILSIFSYLIKKQV